MVGLELPFLREVRRIVKSPETILSALARDIGLEMDTAALPIVVAAARRLSWTQDPFDRLIATQALVADARLITKDRLIRRHCPAALW